MPTPSSMSPEDWDVYMRMIADASSYMPSSAIADIIGIGTAGKEELARIYGIEDPMSKEREQKLIDLGFSLVIAAYGWNKDNPNVTMEELATWARDAFRECGFNVSDPIGSSWGVLHNSQPYIKNTDGKSIQIESAGRPD